MIIMQQVEGRTANQNAIVGVEMKLVILQNSALLHALFNR